MIRYVYTYGFIYTALMEQSNGKLELVIYPHSLHQENDVATLTDSIKVVLYVCI